MHDHRRNFEMLFFIKTSNLNVYVVEQVEAFRRAIIFCV